MTLVENIRTWKEAVESYDKGDFQTSLDKFKTMKDSSVKIAFNIGRTYLSLCDLHAAIQAFQDVIKRDEHLAVGHFMLGVVNLMCTRHSEALVNFTETVRILRDKKFIDYRQLGLRYKLYKCEALLNRAVCLSSLGHINRAVEDLLSALQCKVEPRHSIIDVSLNNLQSGEGVEFLVMDAIFHPPKSKTANLEKRDYLGKSQVVVDTCTYETMEPPLHLRGNVNTSSSAAPQPASSDNGERYRVLYDFIAQNANEVSVKAGDIVIVIETADDGWFTMVTNDSRKTGLVPGSYVEKYTDKEKPIASREALLKDLRKKETRQSLRRVQPPVNTPRSPGQRRQSSNDNDQTYVNGFHQPTRKERPNTGELRRVEIPSPKHRKKELGLQEGPPKFRRTNSLDNLLAEKSPVNISPISGKKILKLKRHEENNNNNSSDDDDGYEKVPEISQVKPYAIHDVITPAERRRGPERPTPPPKMIATMKSTPPSVIRRFPRAYTVSTAGSDEQNRAPESPTFIQKPTRMPPKVPQSPRRKNNTESKENRSQNVELTFTVTTSLNVNSSTTPEDIQNAAKGAIARSIASSLWCEKDDKQIRLDDYRASNISSLVKDGKLKIWCSP